MKIILFNADYSAIIPILTSDFVYGKVSKGKLVDDPTGTRAVSDYIDTNNCEFCVGFVDTSVYAPVDYLLYDANKNFLSTGSTGGYVYLDVSDASYLRFTVKKLDNSVIDLENLKSSFTYQLSNKYSDLFTYGGYGTELTPLMSTNRIKSVPINVEGSVVSVSISDKTYKLDKIKGLDSDGGFAENVANDVAFSQNVKAIIIVLKRADEGVFELNTFQDSYLNLTWT